MLDSRRTLAGREVSVWLLAAGCLVMIFVTNFAAGGVSPNVEPPTRGGSAAASVENPHSLSTTYLVTFTETGLPTGMLWEVGTAKLGSSYFAYATSSGPTAQQRLADGTYDLVANCSGNYSFADPFLSFTVAGAPTSLSVPFHAGVLVTFRETGLPAGALWGVTVQQGSGSTIYNSTAAALDVVLVPGDYGFEPAAEGYTASPSSGSLSVPAPNDASVNVTFTPQPPCYLSGVISPVTANLWLNGDPQTFSAGGGFTFTLAPGTYYVLVIDAGYYNYQNLVILSSGETQTLHIVLVAISAPPSSPAPTATPSLSPAAEAAFVGLGATVVLLAGMVVHLWRHRDRAK